MNNLRKFWLAVSIIGVPFLILFFRDVIPSEEEQFEMAIRSYSIMEFEGIVINKFIDEDEHLSQKIMLGKDGVSKAVVFDIETSGIYDFIEIGDSLMKENESLMIRVIRNDLDTMLKMSFTDSQ